MNDVHVRTHNTFEDTNGGIHEINGGNYGGSSAFEPLDTEFCATMEDIQDSDIREVYCERPQWHRIVIVHTESPRLMLCEIQVTDHTSEYFVFNVISTTIGIIHTYSLCLSACISLLL